MPSLPSEYIICCDGFRAVFQEFTGLYYFSQSLPTLYFYFRVIFKGLKCLTFYDIPYKSKPQQELSHSANTHFKGNMRMWALLYQSSCHILEVQSHICYD